MVKEHFQEKEERQILVFRIAREELGLDISCVREVLRPQEVYHLPKAPDFIEGVINLRGYLVALIDLGKRLNAEQKEEEHNQRIIICRVDKFIVGLMVNTLKEIIALSKEDIKPLPEVVSVQMQTELISGMARVGEKFIPILDLRHILTKKEGIELSTLK